eukprot:TRINITY_DN8039_c0_g1_i3.p1 TRINITY_DN8039_c0_g1~~TRINITY_DN8039_c0_g1_i3.p1  ORF type:complete len:106 (-),score=18.67 TRINITY_DN8039_c0_g1_i3:269-586(-)
MSYNKQDPTLVDVLNVISRSFPHLVHHVLNVYSWGSRVYGTFNDNSDWDYIVICATATPLPLEEEIYWRTRGPCCSHKNVNGNEDEISCFKKENLERVRKRCHMR